MKRTGSIVRFDPERGFGFLRCVQTPADVFFHVRDFDGRSGPPAVGRAVDFEEIHVGGKGPRAMAVRPAGQAVQTARTAAAHRAAEPSPQPIAKAAGRSSTPAGGPSASLGLFLLGLGTELALLAWGIRQARFPPILLAAWLVLNLATFWAYWHDKHSARQQAWRTAENTLHLLSLAGGWPAAWWAQQLLRHKSRKPSFRKTYAATVVAHLLLLAALACWPALVWAP